MFALPVSLVLLFLTTVAVRFAIGLDGVHNDHFHLISGGYQILNGELPIRDFTNFPYDFLTFLSAVVQAIFGHNLLGNFLLTTILAGLGL